MTKQAGYSGKEAVETMNTPAIEASKFESERNLMKKVEDYRAGRLETVTLDELEENLELSGARKEDETHCDGF